MTWDQRNRSKALMKKPEPFSFIYCPIGKKTNNLSAKKISKWHFIERRNSCSMNSTGERAGGCLLMFTLPQLTQARQATISSARDKHCSSENEKYTEAECQRPHRSIACRARRKYNCLFEVKVRCGAITQYKQPHSPTSWW